MQSKACTDDSSNDYKKTISKGRTLYTLTQLMILVVFLVWFLFLSKSGSYHNDMNSKIYEKQTNNQLTSNLPKCSVLLTNNILSFATDNPYTAALWQYATENQ